MAGKHILLTLTPPAEMLQVIGEITIYWSRVTMMVDEGISRLLDIDGEKLNFVGLIPRFTRDGKKLKGAMYVYQLDADKPVIPDLNNAIDGEEHTECGYYGLDEMTSDKVGEYLHKLIEVVLQ